MSPASVRGRRDECSICGNLPDADTELCGACGACWDCTNPGCSTCNPLGVVDEET